MRVKPRPETKPELHPIKLDVADLDYVLDVAGEGAYLKIETKKRVYDDVADLEKYLRGSEKLEKLEIRFEDFKYDEIAIVPSFRAHGDRAKEVAPAIEKYLRDNRRRPVRLFGFIGGFVVTYICVVGWIVLEHAAKHDLAPNHFFNWLPIIFSLLNGWIWSTGPSLVFANLIGPRPQEDRSWLREHVATLVVGVLGTIVGALVTKMLG